MPLPPPARAYCVVMANYDKITAQWPEMADFLANRRNIGLRGDVLTYGANISTDSFTTDAAGFRHTVFDGKQLSVADCVRSQRYGVVLGASNAFGFGIAGNENTIPSRLTARFGFPFANATMPGANSRNLHSLLTGLMAGSGRKPEIVVHSTSGELSTFCDSSLADPVFGSPNRGHLKSLKSSGVRCDADESFPRMLAFTALWTSVIAKLCRGAGVPLVLIHQSTFFEKPKPSKIELECDLGVPFQESQEKQFANFRKFDPPFFTRRKAIADKLGIPLAGWGKTDDLTFIDEFHCDAAGARQMSELIGDAIEPLLSAAPARQAAAATARA